MSRRQQYSLLFLCFLGLLGVLLVPSRGEFYRRLYASGTQHEVVVSESGDSVLALSYEPESARERGVFWIGGEVNSFFPPTGVYENRALVCAGASRPKRILIIGFGGGYSTLFYKSIPDVNEIVIVELLGDVAPFLTRNVESARLTLNDPRMVYVVDDGRRYLNAYPEEEFDLIAIDPLRRHTAGHNNLYSREALEIYQSHLTPNGILCTWIDEFHVIPNTVAHVFPYVDQFQNEFLVASNQPISYDIEYMNRVAEDYADLTADMYGPEGSVSLGSLSTLSLFLRDQDQILLDEVEKPILRDLQPWLEYYFFVRPVKEEIHRNPEAVADFEHRAR